MRTANLFFGRIRMIDWVLYSFRWWLIRCLQVLPLRWVTRSGRKAGHFVCDLDRRYRKVTLPNIALFLGHLCSTTPAPAVYALRYQTPVIPAFCFRVALGKWRIEIGNPIPVFQNGQPRSIKEIIRDMNRAFEQTVLRDPANWFWVHRRWKIPRARPRRRPSRMHPQNLRSNPIPSQIQ